MAGFSLFDVCTACNCAGGTACSGNVCFNVTGCFGAPVSGAVVTVLGPSFSGICTTTPTAVNYRGQDGFTILTAGQCCMTIPSSGATYSISSPSLATLTGSISGGCITNTIDLLMLAASGFDCGAAGLCCGNTGGAGSTAPLTFGDGTNSATLSFTAYPLGFASCSQCADGHAPYNLCAYIGEPYLGGYSYSVRATGWWGTFSAAIARNAPVRISIGNCPIHPGTDIYAPINDYEHFVGCGLPHNPQCIQLLQPGTSTTTTFIISVIPCEGINGAIATIWAPLGCISYYGLVVDAGNDMVLYDNDTCTTQYYPILAFSVSCAPHTGSSVLHIHSTTSLTANEIACFGFGGANNATLCAGGSPSYAISQLYTNDVTLDVM